MLSWNLVNHLSFKFKLLPWGRRENKTLQVVKRLVASEWVSRLSRLQESVKVCFRFSVYHITTDIAKMQRGNVCFCYQMCRDSMRAKSYLPLHSKTYSTTSYEVGSFRDEWQTKHPEGWRDIYNAALDCFYQTKQPQHAALQQLCLSIHIPLHLLQLSLSIPIYTLRESMRKPFSNSISKFRINRFYWYKGQRDFC